MNLATESELFKSKPLSDKQTNRLKTEMRRWNRLSGKAQYAIKKKLIKGPNKK